MSDQDLVDEWLKRARSNLEMAERVVKWVGERIQRGEQGEEPEADEQS